MQRNINFHMDYIRHYIYLRKYYVIKKQKTVFWFDHDLKKLQLT